MYSRKEAKRICIDYIQSDIESNIEQEILPKHIPIQRRMLERASELEPFFVETLEQVSEYDIQLAMELIPDSRFFWSETVGDEIRNDFGELESVNEQLSRYAAIMSNLLERRTEIMNRGRVFCDYESSISSLLENAGEGNYLFESYTSPELKKINFDSRYWPSLSDFFQTIAFENDSLEVVGRDLASDIVISQHRPSKQDTVALLLGDIEQRKVGNLSKSLRYSDDVLATILNIALDLKDEEIFTTEYIKSARQKLRAKGVKYA
ncbi:hypothetical protein A1OO_08600 [Enterovibrio norvegicus FF-33]|uniref:hypothetical protein n=1 Tax=Enterovibrio norvegicus TaxID=188144 RepID=UPI0002D513E4|nr:hypothetical protein [Enterovibrio norvegicus]OEE65858.1 hypothetical protein A1OO_08600 [Enterovibrio norvegicus FF-33]